MVTSLTAASSALSTPLQTALSRGHQSYCHDMTNHASTHAAQRRVRRFRPSILHFPAVIGANGVEKVFVPGVSDSEIEAWRKSAERQGNIEQLG